MREMMVEDINGLVHDSKRLTYEAGWVGEFGAYVQDNGSVSIELDKPFAGDSMTGIGASLSFNLEPRVARKVAQWILDNVHAPVTPAGTETATQE